MSLRQHGIHTAMKSIKNIIKYVKIPNSLPPAINIWNNDAHVLRRTCPPWGNFVEGLKYAKVIPSIANGFINHHFSIKPKWIWAWGIFKKVSPKYGNIESLIVAIPMEPM